MNYMALIGYASQGFVDSDEDSASKWSEDFRRLMLEANLTTQEITSLLCLLSGSIKNGQPLPPYLKTPKPYELTEKLETMDSDILSVRHINESGYAALAVVQICSRCIIGDLNKLLKYVFHDMISLFLGRSNIFADEHGTGLSKKLSANCTFLSISLAQPLNPPRVSNRREMRKKKMTKVRHYHPLAGLGL